MEKKMYVVVRKDLAPIYKMVQGSHALVEFSKKYPKDYKNWDNGYLIFLEVPSYRELRNLSDNLWKYSVPFAYFQEPDLDNQQTALCLLEDHKCWIWNLPLANL